MRAGRSALSVIFGVHRDRHAVGSCTNGPILSQACGVASAGRRGRSDFKEHSMKAIVRTQYGSPDVLQFAEVPTPSPAGNEVLIKLCAASVNPVDLFVLQGAPWNRIPGLRAKSKNTIIGCDIAGRVEAVGRNVKQFQAGDEVFGITGFEGNGCCKRHSRLSKDFGSSSMVDGFRQLSADSVAPEL
jgi:Zn-dependent alcohol dehydrogenase